MNEGFGPYTEEDLAVKAHAFRVTYEYADPEQGFGGTETDVVIALSMVEAMESAINLYNQSFGGKLTLANVIMVERLTREDDYIHLSTAYFAHIMAMTAKGMTEA